MKKLLATLLALLTLLSLTACGSEPQPKTTPKAETQSTEKPQSTKKPKNTPEPTPTEAPVETSKQLVFDSVEEVMENQASDFLTGDIKIGYRGFSLGFEAEDYLYILHDDKFYDIRYNYVGYEQYTSRGIVTKYEKDDLPVINRDKGDKLVVIMNSDAVSSMMTWVPGWAIEGDYIEYVDMDYSISKQYCCIPVVWYGEDINGNYTNGGYYHGDIFRTYPELHGGGLLATIDGKDISPANGDYYTALFDMGYHPFMYDKYDFMIGYDEKNRKIDIGIYRGTEYLEFTYECDALYCLRERVGEIHAERTTKGYLVFDLSDLMPGVYLFSNKLFVIE